MEGSVPGTHTILAQFSYLTPSDNRRDARRGHSKESPCGHQRQSSPCKT